MDVLPKCEYAIEVGAGEPMICSKLNKEPCIRQFYCEKRHRFIHTETKNRCKLRDTQ